MVRLKGKGKRDEAEDTPNTKQSKSIPSSSNPIQSPLESNEKGLSGQLICVSESRFETYPNQGSKCGTQRLRYSSNGTMIHKKKMLFSNSNSIGAQS